MMTLEDQETIKQARAAGCEIPALSIYPPDYWLAVAREFLEEINQERGDKDDDNR